MMTDPDKREAKTLEDELFESIGTVEPAGAEPRRLPAWMLAGQHLRLPWEGEEAPDWRDIASVTAGFGTFLVFDGVVMYAPLRMADPPSTLPQAIVLLLIALGLGGGFARYSEGRWREFGLGLMGAWVLVTMLSVGLFTGLRS